MGLDAVELVMDVEEAFEFSIPDEGYAQMRTVGELHQYILRQLEVQHQLHAEHRTCPSVPAFVEIRLAITSLLAIDRKFVRPSSQLASIIPRRLRRNIWQQLQEKAHINLPPLVLPVGLRQLTRLASLGILIAAACGCVSLLGLPGMLLALPICIGLSMALFAGSRPLAFAFPSGFRTVADIVRAARPPHYPPQRQPPFAADSDAVWHKLVEIIVNVLAVSPSEVRPSARFIEDLRAG